MANAFFKAGFIETWGRGINKVKEEFEKVNLDLPKFKECQGGFMVTIKRAENVRKILGDTSSIPQAFASKAQPGNELRLAEDEAGRLLVAEA